MVKKLNLIHAARGIFVLVIILFAANQVGIEYWNFELLGLSDKIRSGGLDFFFLLSGFMIFHIYQDQIGDRLTGKQFLFKRFIRIYPVYWYILISMVPFYSFFTGKATSIEGVVKSIFLIPQDQPLLSSSWSLSYMLFFYLMFGLLILLGRGLGTMLITAWFLGIVMNFTHGVFGFSYWTHFIFNKYYLYFFLGGFLSYIIKKVVFPMPWLILLTGMAGTVGAVLNAEYHWVVIDDLYNYGIPVSILLCGLALMDQKYEYSLPGWLNFLSRSSYSLYLSHLPGLIIQYHLYTEWQLERWMDHYTASILFIIGTILIGCLTHLIIEKPLLSFILFHRSKTPVSTNTYIG